MNRPRRAFEQAQSEFGLQLLDLMTDCRGGQEQGLGSLAEALALGGDTEDAQSARTEIVKYRVPEVPKRRVATAVGSIAVATVVITLFYTVLAFFL